MKATRGRIERWFISVFIERAQPRSQIQKPLASKIEEFSIDRLYTLSVMKHLLMWIGIEIELNLLCPIWEKGSTHSFAFTCLAPGSYSWFRSSGLSCVSLRLAQGWASTWSYCWRKLQFTADEKRTTSSGWVRARNTATSPLKGFLQAIL